MSIPTTPLWQQYMRKCIHYTGTLGPGMQRRTHCAAGQDYGCVTDDRGRMACFTTDIRGEPQDSGRSCPMAEFMTEEEAKAKEAAAYARLRQYNADIEAGICPNHKRPITLHQIGRCVYAEPCNCRLYQGTLPKPKGGR